MKIHNKIDDFAGSGYTVATVGTFDGLHIGHQKIIARMKEVAAAKNGTTVLITFEPHPRIVLNSAPEELRFITSQKRKFRLLEQFELDHIIVIPFTIAFAKTPSEVFIRDYLVKQVGVKMLIVGYDHHFGKNREGNYEQLYMLSKKLGFDVEEIPAQFLGEIPVSSTKIRAALNEGNVSKANQMLGYEYSIAGKVVPGDRIGRTIGFPTANIDVEDKLKLIAASGVYACRVEIGGNFFGGMANIGTRPTLGKDILVTEVHIFDFQREIYDEKIIIYLIDRIRDEKKFESLEALREQLVIDQKEAIRIISTSGRIL
ncbi:MAG: bifunctional riboflavin kinase/FAD synthetase [Bacteroidales bacterium]